MRQEGFDGEVTALAGEPVIPYHRPELSSGYLHGKAELEGLAVHPQAWYAEHHVDLRLDTRAVAVDFHGYQVTTDAEEILRYDRLLLATGAALVVPPVPGAHCARTLRTAADAEDPRHRVRAGGRVVVIGAGWIGLDVAAAVRLAVCEVTVVEVASTPLRAVLGAVLGERFAAVHRDHGVVMRLGSGVTEIVEGGVVLACGDRLPAASARVMSGCP